MVQGRTTRGNGKTGTQANLHTKPPRRTCIRTSGNQQNVPVDEP